MTDNDKIPKDPYDVELPQSIIESYARFLVPLIREYYASEQGQRDFKELQERQNKDNT